MPPRARATARTKETGPPPIHTDTIQLGPSQSIGTVLQHQLFFNSEQWITPLYRDINALLNSFEHEWTEEFERQISTSREPRVVQDEQPHQSPFEVFKQLWRDKGWSFVHLLGVADGPLREPWGESVLRGFAEHFNVGEKPLRQIGALFASFIFCKTQSKDMVKQYLKLDIPTLEHLVSFPTRVSPALDPTNSSPLSPPPSSDVDIVLRTLLSRSSGMFHLVPTQVYLHPPNLPSVLIRDVKVKDTDGTAKRLLGIEEEIEWLRRGKQEQLERVRTKQREIERKRKENRQDPFGHDVEEQFEEQEDEFDAGDDARSQGIVESWVSRLSKTSRAYSSVKARSGRGKGSGGSVLTKPKSKLQLEVMNKAEEATMYKVLQTGLDGMVEKRVGGKMSRPERGESDKRLLNLVRGYETGPGGDRRKENKRRKTKEGPSQSIHELDSVLSQLDQSSVYE
ncbi:hypothetical protein JCM16303_004910 [Sporobolomyces ruberrimus]